MQIAAAAILALKCPALSTFSIVLFDGARSAEPPISQGTFLATALSTWPDETRLATPLASAGNTGMSLSQPSGSSPRQIRFRSAANCG